MQMHNPFQLPRFIPYMKHFVGPVPTVLKPLMFVIEIISHCARPLSLSLRLFGNMMAGHILLAIIHEARKHGGAPLLEAVDRYNDEVCSRADETRGRVKSK